MEWAEPSTNAVEYIVVTGAMAVSRGYSKY